MLYTCSDTWMDVILLCTVMPSLANTFFTLLGPQHPSWAILRPFIGSFPYIPWTLTFLSCTDFNEMSLSSHLCANAFAPGHPTVSPSSTHLDFFTPCWITLLENSNTHDRPLSHTDIFLILLEHWGTALICLRTLRLFTHLELWQPAPGNTFSTPA